MKLLVRDIDKIKVKIVDVEGEVDVYTSMELKKELNKLVDDGNKKIMINLERVTYMDSSGLGILVAILKRLKKEKGSMKIVKLTPSIKKIFELTRLTKFFDIFETEEEAEKTFDI